MAVPVKQIIKAVLGGIGGGFNGAAKGANTAELGSSNTAHFENFKQLGYDVGNQGVDKAKDKISGMVNMFGGDDKGKTEGAFEGAQDASSGADASAAADAVSAIADGIVKSKGMKQYIKREDGTVIPISASYNIYATKKEIKPEEIKETKKESKKCLSDINLKEVYKEIDDSIIDNFSRISAIDFKYNGEAQKKYCGSCGVDNKEHVGVIAQELEENPATKGTVETNEEGNKVVNTAQLTMADTAAIAELSRRVLALEEAVKNINGGNC